MKKISSLITAIAISISAFLSPVVVATLPVSAAGGTACSCPGTTEPGTMVDGAILHYCDCKHGESIREVLKLVVNIMTVGIGVLGAVGLTISGIQYLTAGGNEEQTRKSKRRIFEIIIGLAAYVMIYAILNWLIPDFHTF